MHHIEHSAVLFMHHIEHSTVLFMHHIEHSTVLFMHHIEHSTVLFMHHFEHSTVLFMHHFEHSTVLFMHHIEHSTVLFMHHFEHSTVLFMHHIEHSTVLFMHHFEQSTVLFMHHFEHSTVLFMHHITSSIVHLAGPVHGSNDYPYAPGKQFHDAFSSSPAEVTIHSIVCVWAGEGGGKGEGACFQKTLLKLINLTVPHFWRTELRRIHAALSMSKLKPAVSHAWMVAAICMHEQSRTCKNR